MNAGLIGAALGFVLGVVNFFVLQGVATKVRQTKSETSGTTARVLGIVAWLDILVFPVMGYFIGPMVV